jgi:integrase/recombinase XerD
MRERGVCERAADGYLRKVRRFLSWRTSAGTAGLEGLTAADVSAFVLAECPGHSKHWGRHLTLSLRSFLAFLHVDGVLEESLARAVPRVAGWRLAGLPRPLDPGVAQCLLASCDQATVIGRRDRAMLLLLWRLALRRGEVAGMTLDDLDSRGAAAGVWQEPARRGAAAPLKCRGGAGRVCARRPPARRDARGVRGSQGTASAAHPNDGQPGRR